jgi:hypothetical protein
MSTYESIPTLKQGLGAPPGGTQVYKLPAGTELPPGVNVAADGGLIDAAGNPIPAGHNTMYPATELGWEEFSNGIQKLDWQHMGKH